MIAVKKHFGKEGGTTAYHGYQSFAPGEATPEIVHEIAVKLAERLWGEKYQVVVATHLDKANHLHSHFVLNTLSFVDEKKFHRTVQDYRDMQIASDELCREYGLSVLNQSEGKSKSYTELQAETEGRSTLRGSIRADIDRAIAASTTGRDFLRVMTEMGYEFKTRVNSFSNNSIVRSFILSSAAFSDISRAFFWFSFVKSPLSRNLSANV